MAGSVLYLCESAGARILAYGSGISQIGTEYQFDLVTWEDIPSGESGDNLFRSIDAALKPVGNYSIGITPTIDGVDLSEQAFSGVGNGTPVVCQAFVSQRGARISARLRSFSRGGDIELEQLSAMVLPIRNFP